MNEKLNQEAEQWVAAAQSKTLSKEEFILGLDIAVRLARELHLAALAFKGTEAWKDVPDAATWVRDLRG